METITLEQVNQNILNLHKEISELKEEIHDLNDIELNVRPKYLAKLNQIEKGPFFSRKEFDREMG